MDQSIMFCRARDDVTLAWARSGRGPPLVKAANWLSHLEHDWSSPVWRPLLERLGEHHTVIRYDERGCGLSDREVEDLSFEAWVRDLEAVVDAAGLERFPLLGISQGGPIAIAYAVRHPERVSRLILYGTYTRGRLQRDSSRQAREEAETLVRLVRMGWGKDVDAYRRLFASFFWPDATLEEMQAFAELQRLSAGPATAARIVEGFDQVDVSDLAPRVEAPTLVLHVEGDARIPFEEGRRTAAAIPGAAFVPLPGVNHVLAPQDPAFEPFLARVEEFLGAPGPSRGVARLVEDLTDRERDVLELLAAGLDNGAIAEALHISPKTVRNHVSNVFAKLGVGHRGEAVGRHRSPQDRGSWRRAPRAVAHGGCAPPDRVRPSAQHHGAAGIQAVAPALVSGGPGAQHVRSGIRARAIRPVLALAADSAGPVGRDRDGAGHARLDGVRPGVGAGRRGHLRPQPPPSLRGVAVRGVRAGSRAFRA